MKNIDHVEKVNNPITQKWVRIIRSALLSLTENMVKSSGSWSIYHLLSSDRVTSIFVLNVSYHLLSCTRDYIFIVCNYI